MELIIMRHGATPGNEARRYVGAQDQPLSERGRQQAEAAGVCPDVPLVYVTPLSRTQQTAAICFPNAQQVVVPGLQEMDFGVFAGRTADEMVDDPDYRAWVDGMCLGPCPGGESREQVTERICTALDGLVRDAVARGESRIVLVAHGGTMMSALGAFCSEHPEREYWEWLVGNCQGYIMQADPLPVPPGGLRLHDVRRFEDLSFLSS